MSFTRIGTPVDVTAVDFKSKDAYTIVCKHCGERVGKGIKRLAKFYGTEIIVVAPHEFVCPDCGKKSPVVKAK